MCSNYRQVTSLERIATFFGLHSGQISDRPEFPPEVYPTQVGSFIRLNASGEKMVEAGHFGLLPHFAKELVYGRRTYNARSETVHQLPSFRTAWKRGQRCIIPAEKIYEPNWETGKAIRWAVELPEATPMGIAGIWAEHPYLTMSDGSPMLSFAMLTVNADGHPIFSRLHRPEDEKRMVIILHPDQYDAWLTCKVEDASTFFRQYLGELHAYAAPAPPRKPRAKKGAQDSDFPPVVDD